MADLVELAAAGRAGPDGVESEKLEHMNARASAPGRPSGATKRRPRVVIDPRSPEHPRRRELIAVATRLFAERGYPSVLMEDIADALGLLKGSLYYYVNSKEQLLKECLGLSVMRELLEQARLIADLAVGPVEQLRLMMRAQTALWVQYQDVVLLWAKGENRWLSEEAWQDYAEHRHELRDMYLGILRAGIERGEFKLAAGDSAFVVQGILGLLGSLPRWFEQSGAWSLDYIGNRWAEMIISALVHPMGTGEGTHGVPTGHLNGVHNAAARSVLGHEPMLIF
jgi:AcrR family transcriptional regulator